MITIEQIKAARALLGWNQDQLANAAGVSKPALANIERRLSNPRAETLNALQSAMEEAGVEFTDGPGVKLTNDTIKVHIFKGSDSIQRLWNDILATLKPGDERLIAGVDENKFVNITGERFAKMMEKYKKVGIKGRILTLEGNKNFSDFTSEYRWVPELIFLDAPYYVYANKYAILVWEPELKIVLIENKAIADLFRAQFERHWKAAKKVS